MDLGLSGARAVVTGGSKGMGRAIAELLAAEGASVAVLARGKEALDETVDALGAVGCPDAVGLPVDVGDPEQVNDAFRSLEERWGQLNVLVNTVGPMDGSFEDLDEDGWAAALNLGLLAGVRCVRAGLPLLRRAEWGRIVNFGAHSIKRQSARLVAYTASSTARKLIPSPSCSVPGCGNSTSPSP